MRAPLKCEMENSDRGANLTSKLLLGSTSTLPGPAQTTTGDSTSFIHLKSSIQYSEGSHLASSTVKAQSSHKSSQQTKHVSISSTQCTSNHELLYSTGSELAAVPMANSNYSDYTSPLSKTNTETIVPSAQASVSRSRVQHLVQSLSRSDRFTSVSSSPDEPVTSDKCSEALEHPIINLIEHESASQSARSVQKNDRLFTNSINPEANAAKWSSSLTVNRSQSHVSALISLFSHTSESIPLSRVNSEASSQLTRERDSTTNRATVEQFAQRAKSFQQSNSLQALHCSLQDLRSAPRSARRALFGTQRAESSRCSLSASSAKGPEQTQCECKPPEPKPEPKADLEPERAGRKRKKSHLIQTSAATWTRRASAAEGHTRRSRSYTCSDEHRACAEERLRLRWRRVSGCAAVRVRVQCEQRERHRAPDVLDTLLPCLDRCAANAAAAASASTPNAAPTIAAPLTRVWSRWVCCMRTVEADPTDVEAQCA